MIDALVIVDHDLVVRVANLAFYRLFNLEERSVVGRHLFEIGGLVEDHSHLRPLLEAVLTHDITINRIRLEQRFPVIGRRMLNLSASRVAQNGLPIRYILISLQDVTQIRLVNQDTADSLARTRASLVEVNHRVKNNLTSIKSMLSIEARAITDKPSQDVLNRIGLRVASMARLYELLTVGEVDGTVHMVPYFRSICDAAAEIFYGREPGLVIEVECEDLKVDTKSALALGAIVNELVTNAATYAFVGRTMPGQVRVMGERKADGFCISVADNGVGVGNDNAVSKSTGIGMRLVDFYARSLNAEFQSESGPRGTVCSLTVPWSTIRLEHDDLYIAADVFAEQLASYARPLAG